MEYKNGDRYSGEWKDDFMNGRGLMNYANGDKYDGDFIKGKKEGKGKLIN